jgi:hypothetical protein
MGCMRNISQSQSHFTTGGLPPFSLSWRQAPWDSRPVTLLSKWILSVIVLISFAIAAGSRQCIHSQVQVPRDSWPLPQLGGPGSRIYIPQEQGGPVIPPGTGFSSLGLLRLAGLRWRHSIPPPHGMKHVIYKNSVHTSQEMLHLRYEYQSVNVV